jgi:hypothetical protein
VAETCRSASAEPIGHRRVAAVTSGRSCGNTCPGCLATPPPAAPAASRPPVGEAAARVSRSGRTRGRIFETGRSVDVIYGGSYGNPTELVQIPTNYKGGRCSVYSASITRSTSTESYGKLLIVRWELTDSHLLQYLLKTAILSI